MIWNILAFAFTSDEDSFQLWSSLLATGFSIYGFLVLFIGYSRRTQKSIYSLNYIAWIILFVVTILDVIFLVRLIINGNNYELVRTNYAAMRISYYHSTK